LGRQRVAIDPEGVHYSTREADGLLRWSAVQQVGRSGGHVFLYLTAVSALVVPRRAFANEEAFRAFHRLARQYREDAATARFPAADRPPAETYHARDDRLREGGPPAT